MSAIGFALAYVGGFAVAAYLVVQNHPWFALLVFILTSSIHSKEAP